MRAWSSVLILLLLAGCSNPRPGAAVEDPGPSTADPFVAPVLPCEADPTNGLSSSFEVVTLETFGWEPGYREELDIAVVDGRTLMAVARPEQGGIDMMDASDPRSLEHLATWDGGGVADDIKFTTDGTGIVMGGSDMLRIVDVRDPTQPGDEHTFQLDGVGAHMVAVWPLDGQDHVSISKAEGGDISIFAIDGEAGNRTLRRLSHLAATPLGDNIPGRPDPLRTHDTWFEVDPETGAPLLWVANVWWGVIAYDVSDPTLPVPVVTIPNSPPYPGYMHNVQVTHIDGRRLVVGAQEYGTGVLKVWDATDLANPQYIAYYASEVVTTAFHNLQVVGQYVYASHFDEGMFVFDLAAIEQGPVAAAMVPFAHVPAPGQREDVRVPVGLVQGNFGTQDVEIRDGIIWTSEAYIGVQSLVFGCLAVGDPANTSTG